MTNNPSDASSALHKAGAADSSPIGGQIVDPVVAGFDLDQILAVYVARLVPKNFTDQARGALHFEGKQYLDDICEMADIRRRADRNAEMVLQNHIKDSVSSLRSKKDSATSVLADWSKWIGFTFLGLTIQQWNNVRHQKSIVQGSVSWLVFDAIITAALIVIGFKIDRPFSYFFSMFRRKNS